jgi:hypothetical protein
MTDPAQAPPTACVHTAWLHRAAIVLNRELLVDEDRCIIVAGPKLATPGSSAPAAGDGFPNSSLRNRVGWLLMTLATAAC